MRDMMIDIETLGTRPGSVILSIGAVAFDAEAGEVGPGVYKTGPELYMAIDPASAEKAGLTMDVSTVQWWMQQSEDARAAAFSGFWSLIPALEYLAAFIKRCGPSRLWAKPPMFDLVLLESAYRAVGQEIPWSYKINRDCRTLFDITGTVQPDVGTAHNALDDAKAQAFGVIAAYGKLKAGTLTAA